MGKLRPGRRQGLAQGHPASQQHGKLCAPAPTIPQGPGGCSGLQGMGTQEFPLCPGPPWPFQAPPNHVWQGGHEGTVGEQATREAMGSHSQTGQRIPAGVPPGHPRRPTPLPRTQCPLSAPDTLSCRCPWPPTPPHTLLLPGRGGGGLHKPKHPYLSPQPPKGWPHPLSGSQAMIREGRQLAPSHPGQNPNPWTPTPMHFSFLRTPLPNPSTQGGSGHPSSHLLPRPGLCWPIVDPCLHVTLPGCEYPHFTVQEANSGRKALAKATQRGATEMRSSPGRESQPTPSTSCREQLGTEQAWWAAQREHPGGKWSPKKSQQGCVCGAQRQGRHQRRSRVPHAGTHPTIQARQPGAGTQGAGYVGERGACSRGRSKCRLGT